MRLQNQVAIVTGAGRGIGKAIALALAREAATTVLAARTQAEIEAAAAEIQEKNCVNPCLRFARRHGLSMSKIKIMFGGGLRR